MSHLFDSRSHLETWESEDTTMLAMSQELDEHTVHLRKAVLASVASIRTRIHQQTAELLEREREETRETQRRLLQQVDGLTRLVETRNEELEKERQLNERLVAMVSRQKRRARERALATEALQRWNEHVKAKKFRERMCAHLTDVRRERQARLIFNAWRVDAERQKAADARAQLEGEHRRTVARLTNEFQSTENKMKLEVLALREQLSKEEERQALLQEKHKAAFMRGVCALNLEAMQAIRGASADDDISVASLMQGLNMSGFAPGLGFGAASSAASAQPPSTERLMEQQLLLHRQLQALEANAAAPTSAMDAMMPPGPLEAAPPRPMTAPRAVAAGVNVPAATLPRNEPRVTVVVNSKYVGNGPSTLSAGGASVKPRAAAALRPTTNTPAAGPKAATPRAAGGAAIGSVARR